MPSLPPRVGNVELESRRMLRKRTQSEELLRAIGLSGTGRCDPADDRAHRYVARSRPAAFVRETAAQFQIAYRLYPSERQRRQEQLNAAVIAWRAAPRTDANNERFAIWLRATIRLDARFARSSAAGADIYFNHPEGDASHRATDHARAQHWRNRP